jgi:hypothetical protein
MAEEKKRVHWHPAFRQAIRAEFGDYADALEFHDEFALNTEPLRIDVLIIKKKHGVEIVRNIGRIFRAVNVVEYKSPAGGVSVADYNKVMAYAYLYMSLHGLAVDGITVTIVQNAYPKALVGYLRSVCKFSVTENYSGIYYVEGSSPPIQIIVGRKLSKDDGLLLRTLASCFPG